MENAELLFHNICHHSATHELLLRTKRGLHVGTCPERYGAVSRRPEDYARAVSTWYLVPRWMSPQEVLNKQAPQS